jgi:hypothetical protein
LEGRRHEGGRGWKGGIEERNGNGKVGMRGEEERGERRGAKGNVKTDCFHMEKNSQLRH